jgi:uncharacterized protein
MTPTENGQQQEESLMKTIISLLLLLSFVFIGMVIGELTIYVLLGFDQETYSNLISDYENTPGARLLLHLMQGMTAICGFIAAPAFFLWRFDRSTFESVLYPSRLKALPLLLVPVIVLVSMVFNGIIIEWNQSIDFSGLSPAFETWANTEEARRARLTEFLTNYQTFSGFMVGVVIIAIIPAVGEEFLFRGVLQNKLDRKGQSGHVAVWITAIIFSAFHFQFYGFLPRLILGALFGYLYLWSNNLLYPILAHFINNGFTLLMLYLRGHDIIDFDIENTESVSLLQGMAAFLFTLGLMLVFRQFFPRPTEPTAKALHE